MRQPRNRLFSPDPMSPVALFRHGEMSHLSCYPHKSGLAGRASRGSISPSDIPHTAHDKMATTEARTRKDQG